MDALRVFVYKHLKKINTTFMRIRKNCQKSQIVFLFRQSLAIYIKNLIIGLYVLYTLNTHVKFCANLKLFTI